MCITQDTGHYPERVVLSGKVTGNLAHVVNHGSEATGREKAETEITMITDMIAGDKRFEFKIILC